MDVDFATRGARLDELVAAMRACWGPDPVSFDGEYFSIPASIVRPKPVQQPHPPLLSGMRSAAGLRRTAQLFDFWHPASGTIETIIETAAEIDAMRTADRPPIRVVQRIFSEPPFVAPGLGARTIEQLCDDVRHAREAGIAHVVVDTGFTTEVRSPEDWASFPDRLAPLLDAAR
jgi:hypothetical protein